MAVKTPEETRQRIQGIKRFLLLCLVISTIAAVIGFRASFGIMPESAESLRLLARAGIGICSACGAIVVFTVVFTVADILTKTRNQLKSRMSSISDQDSAPS